MLDRWIVNLVIMFVLRQISTFQNGIDWTLVRADADARIRQLMPGQIFDDAAAAVVLSLIDGVEFVLGAQGDLQAILHLLSSGDYQGAGEALKRLLISFWQPTDMSGARASKALVA